jgi:hypothetical protein
MGGARAEVGPMVKRFCILSSVSFVCWFLFAGLLVTKKKGLRLLKSRCLLCSFQKLPKIFAPTQLGSKFLAMIFKNE